MENENILLKDVYRNKKKQFIEFVETHGFSKYAGGNRTDLMPDECMYYKEYPSSYIVVLCSNNSIYQRSIFSFVIVQKEDSELPEDMYDMYFDHAVSIETNDIDLIAAIDRLDCKDIHVAF
jgi:hypothetical protein